MNHLYHDPKDSSAFAEEMFTVNLTQEQVDHFWENICKTEGGCWDWKNAVDRRGYGKMGLKYPGTKRSRMLLSHRVAFYLTTGEFPSKLSVLHHCDRPVCCNPDHLFLGTQLDNMRDMIQKGRKSTQHSTRTMGEKVNTAKLNADQVREIRRLYAEGHTQENLGALYKVTSVNISAIIRRETWKHVI